MSNESQVLAAATQSREAYDAIERHVREGDFTEQAALVWRGIVGYYERDGDCTSIEGELLAREIGREVTSDKHRAQFESIVEALTSAEVSPANIVHDFIAVKREAAADRLASALLAHKHSPELLEEYESWATADALTDEVDEDEIVRGMPIAALSEAYDPDKLIKVWPSPLNERLDGGLLRGHHMLVFAMVEMGKTLFVVNAMAGFLRHGHTVLYVGNEEPMEDVALRLVCRLTLKDKYDVLDHPEAAYEQAMEHGYNNFISAKLYPGSIREIDKLMAEYKPDVLVIDQLRNLTTKEDGYVQQLQRVAMGARVLGKRHEALVISVTQAGDSASGKRILETGDVDSSNVGIPAAVDVMVGLAQTPEDEAAGRLTLSLPKNKRSGRHDFVSVRVDPTRSRLSI